MLDPFTDEQIEQLTTEINHQLLELGTADPAELRATRRGPPRTERQRKAIAEATGQGRRDISGPISGGRAEGPV
jgi:hypothetical protein